MLIAVPVVRVAPVHVVDVRLALADVRLDAAALAAGVADVLVVVPDVGAGAAAARAARDRDAAPEGAAVRVADAYVGRLGAMNDTCVRGARQNEALLRI